MKKARKLLPIILTIILSFSVLLGITACSNKQVPVYQGMSISNTISAYQHTAVSYTASPINHHSPDENGKHYDGDYHGKHDDIDQENPFEEGNIDNVADSLVVEGTQTSLYYATPNADIYVTVHIHNPDNFEIMSFTLNGQKYSSYMFEDGSNMEQLILKVNVGNADGIVDYTIDAIKYVDGSSIKDVRMDGEKTVKVGVHTSNQPTVTINEEKIGYNDLALSAMIEDSKGLIAYSNGTIKAIVYDGETVIAEKSVTLGNNTLNFDELKTNTVYQYAIVADYDNLDGNGFGAHILYKKAFGTKAIVCFDNINVTDTGVSFSYCWDESWQTKTLTSAVLLKDGETVQTLTQTDLTINGLLSGNTYLLKATYQNGDKAEEITLSFTTIAKSIPTVELSINELTNNIVASADSISFTLTETDESNVGAITKIELIPDDGETVSLSDLTARTFTSLQENSKYTVKITYEYDLNDGNGTQTVYAESSVYTSLADKSIIYELDGETYRVKSVTDTTIESATVESNIAGVPVTKIGFRAFDMCMLLETVVLPDTITIIDKYAFNECKKLKNITLPDSLTLIGEWSFYACESLTEIDIPDSVVTIENSAFSSCVGLTNVTVPDNVTTMGGGVFSWCTNLKMLTLPTSIVITERFNLWRCESLESIIIPNGVTEFYLEDCKSLKSVVIPNGVTKIIESAFQECSKLQEVVIPDSVKIIDTNAFYGCSSLTNIIIPDSIKTIGASAFCKCYSLVEVVNKSLSITIEKGAETNGCVGLYALAVYNSNDTFTSKLTNDNGYIVYTDGNEKILVAYKGTATALTIPSYITKINHYALYYFNSLESVDFGNANWYYTDSYDDWKNQTNGTLLDLTDTALNVTLLTETNTTYYWYKL